MNNFERDEQIERFLSGSLEAAEKAAFEKELAENPAFRTEVAEQKLVLEALADGPSVLNFRSLLAQASAAAASEATSQKIVDLPQNMAEKGRVVPLVSWKWALALAASLALAVFAWRNFGEKAASSQQLFAQNVEATNWLSASAAVRGGDEKGQPTGDATAQKMIESAENDSKNSQFAAALEKLETAKTAAATAAVRSVAARNRALVFLKTKNWAAAEAELSQIEGLAEDRAWLEALALAGQPSKKAEARDAMQAFSENGNFSKARREAARAFLAAFE